MAKSTQKVNHTNPGKKVEYHGKQLGHSTSEGNPDLNQFEGKDLRVERDETTGPDAGATVHSQTHRAQGASPVRVRLVNGFGKINHGGSHVVNATQE